MVLFLSPLRYKSPRTCLRCGGVESPCVVCSSECYESSCSLCHSPIHRLCGVVSRGSEHLLFCPSCCLSEEQVQY